MTAFDRLSALDALFLDIESDRNPMHIGLTAIFEKGPLRTPSGAVNQDLLRRRVRAALASLPRFRRRLARVPIFGRPMLVDGALDLDAHLRFVTLVRGDDAELREVVERIYADRLDRSRPLWEMWVLDGLSGDRFAIVTKAHHCLVDGVAGIAALTSMLRTTPDAGFDESLPPANERPPPVSELFRAEVKRLGQALRRGPSELAAAARTVWTGSTHMAGAMFPPASRSPLPPSTPGTRRRFAWLELDLAAVRAVKNTTSATMNDVALATVSGALSRLVSRRRQPVNAQVFRALVPVSTHASADPRLDNKVSLLFVRLPVAAPDARTRLDQVCAATRAEKASRGAEAIALAEDISDTGWFGLTTAVARGASLLRPYNLIVTNVRGPEQPLYLLGARMLAVYPLVPLYGHGTLGIALVTYDDRVFWGLSGDAAREEDLAQVADDLRAAFTALSAEVLRPPEHPGPVAARLRSTSVKELGLLNWMLWKAISRAAGTPDAHLFGALGRQRRLFRAWLHFAGRLMPGGALSRRDTELVILRVAHLRGCEYELDHHRRMAPRAGIDSVTLQRVFTGPEAPGWTARERALLGAVDSLVQTKDLDDAGWDGIRAHYSESDLVELCLLVGHYEMLATVIAALRIPRDFG